MNPTKSELRYIFKTKRLSMTREERLQKSEAINERLMTVIDWSKIQTVHCFEPIETLGEVNILDFPNGIKLFTSRKIDGDWKIVPTDGNSLVPEQFDVIIVPMLGFDHRLHRIGYGGGHYDKFLATQPAAKKIGVCFEICHVENIPMETHDIQLNEIITEVAIYKI